MTKQLYGLYCNGQPVIEISTSVMLPLAVKLDGDWLRRQVSKAWRRYLQVKANN